MPQSLNKILAFTDNPKSWKQRTCIKCLEGETHKRKNNNNKNTKQ